jgi:putative transposase
MILLHPTAEQRSILRRWMGSYRFAFNFTIDQIESAYDAGRKDGVSYKFNRKAWKAALVAVAPWVEEIAAHTIYGAMMDAEMAYKLHIRKLAKRLPSSLPRSRKRKQRSFYVLGNAITKNGIYTRLLGPMKSAEPLPDKPSDSRIIYEAGRWYLRMPVEHDVMKPENQGRVVSIDPGVRTFSSCFSPDGLHKIGQGSFGRIAALGLRLDDLISRTRKEKDKKRKKRMRLAQQRMRVRIRNLRDDFHYQSIGWLLRNFDTIIIPDNNFVSAVCRVGRKIRSKVVRALLTWSFAKFRDRLCHKAAIFGKRVIQVCESYTSKTANWTGEIKQLLGGSKTISSGGHKIDRDVNGALGIMLKALLLAQPETQVSAFNTLGN